ncbi:MAG: MGMT family protein [Bacteroidetes bacterium]|jgi:methylated-DNA-protein-cysteine methyltransferase related protein|nr:MGMT family protein [Bacteroidota bacterium]
MSVPIKLSERHSDFFEQVYEVVKLIPRGRVTSYGTIAEYLGAKRGARMVGWAMNNCLKGDAVIPAHRVVNRQGLLTGKAHFPSMTAMQERLEAEGLTIIDDQIQNFQEHFWNPSEALIL